MPSAAFLGPLLLEQPLEISDARRASHVLAQQRRSAEERLEELAEQAAEAERFARKELARCFLIAEGNSAAQREAHARSLAADAFYQRDLAVGLVKAQHERLRGLEGERSQLKTICEWSAKMAFQGVS